VIDLFASQNLDPPPQPPPATELIPTPQVPQPPVHCVTTTVGQLGKLRAGCLPAQPAEPVLPASDTIESTPLIDTVPDILARIVAKKRADLAARSSRWKHGSAKPNCASCAPRFSQRSCRPRPRHHREIKKRRPARRPLARFRPSPHRPRLPIGRSRRPQRAHRPGILPGQPARSRVRPRRRIPSVLRKDFTIDPTQNSRPPHAARMPS
jgi:hypothetical protein